LNAWHQDQVTKVPTDAKRIASTDHCLNAALIYGNKALTIQPHPEFGDNEMNTLLDRKAPNLISPEHIKTARKSLLQPNDNPLAAAMIVDFLKEAHLARLA